jgi:predicted nucleic acid-binding protein
MPGLRVVLDTNVLVSGLAYPGSIPGRIVGAWRQGSLDVVLSHYILDELARVLPKLTRLQLSPTDIRDLLDSLMFITNIATWRAAQTQYLITGDKDLLALAAAYPIVTPADFWARHGQ